MLTSNFLSRLALVVSLTASVFVNLSSSAPNPEMLTKRERVQAMARQLGTYGITGVTSGRGSDGSVPFRLEIRQLQQNADQWNLYLLGLSRLQAVPQDQLLSWYQISGIHGRPFVDWDNVHASPGDDQTGYCTHASILFPTWHRPYLALYEQVLFNTIQQIANEFNGSDKTRYQKAAANFRIPYWDWAAAPSGGGSVLPSSVSSSSTVSVRTPQGQRTINNPLFQYTFHPLDPKQLPDPPLSTWKNTLRYPSNQTPSATSRNNLVAQQLDNNRLSLRDRLYNLFTAYHDFTQFSNKASFAPNGSSHDSVESVHDQIHGLVGSGGHMGYVPYSAFDPIFYLHHTMVDRVVAIWQALNPDTYVTPQVTQSGTYTNPPGSTEDVNTPLTPFHSDTHGTFWTSVNARSVKTFGYTYPELVDWNVSPQQLQTNIKAAVNKLYGSTAPANTVHRRDGPIGSKANLETRAMSEFSPNKHLVARENKTDPTLANSPSGLLKPDNKYYEYLANIKVNQFALDSSFFVHVFLGNFSVDPFYWSFDPNLVGSYCVLATTPGKGDSAREVIVTGVIPLTTAILNAIKLSQLASLDPQDVDPYLKKNLQWRVTKMDDTAVPNTDVNGLQVSVVSSVVTKPQNDADFPQWGDFSTHQDVTADHPTGLQPGGTS